MSNLKNTYGFSSSLLDAIRSVHETTHKTDDKISKETKLSKEKLEKDKRRTKQFNISPSTYDDPISSSRMQMKKEEVEEEIDESLMKSVKRGLTLWGGSKHLKDIQHHVKNASDDQLIRLSKGKNERPDLHTPRDLQTKLINRELKRRYGVNPGLKNEEVELDEADKTYPFKANELAPLVVQLRALLNFLSKSGALKKSMREHAELVEAYIGKEITEEQLEEMISFVDDLMEGRPKGSKNKSKMASAPVSKPSKTSSENDEDEDYEDVHPAASRDGRHIIPELNAAAGDKKGAKVQTSGGQRHVPQHVAGKMVSHLMSLKPAERGEHSAHIFNGSVPKVKTLNHVKTNVLIKQMGSEKKFGSDADVKRGRGRPKKAV